MKIVERMPYFTERTEVTVGAEKVRVRPYQIVVWVSLSAPSQQVWDPRMPAFPAILDPGNNHNFSIFQSHLQRWAGIVPEHLLPAGGMRESGARIPLHKAAIWLHRNQRGSRALRRHPAYRMSVEDGIAVYPDDGFGARHLPLLGLRALTDNYLQVMIDGANRNVTIETERPWWWPFA